MAAANCLNIDPKTGTSNKVPRKQGVSSTRASDINNVPPIDYDLDDLDKKTPDELNKILKQMQDYNKRS